MLSPDCRGSVTQWPESIARHALQHPYGESDETKVLDPESTGRAGVVGYIGAPTDQGLSYDIRLQLTAATSFQPASQLPASQLNATMHACPRHTPAQGNLL